MKIYNNKPALKLSSIAVTLASILGTSLSTSAIANEAEADDTEVIQVRGIRGSLKESLNTKRFSNSIVDAITSEDIGKFPDKNIGDALQRISGVTVDRQYGEVNGVTIRGTAPEQSRILLNGQTVASVDWYDLGDATRTFNLELLSAEQVSGIEVYKSPEARIEEGALGGTVNLKTRQPLNIEAHTYMASVEGSRSSLYEENDISYSGLASWKNEDESFGILAAYSIEKLTSGRHVRESIGEYKQQFEADPVSGEEALVGAWSIGSQAFKAERERTSMQLTAQFAPTEELKFTLDYFNFEFDNPHVNHNFLTVMGRGAGAENVVNNARGGTVSATILPAYASIIYNPVVRHAVNMEVDVTNFTAEYQGDNYVLSGVIGQSTSEGGTQGGSSSWWIPATDEGDKINDPNYPDGQTSVDGGFSYNADGPYQVTLTSLDATDASQLKFAHEANYETTVQDHEVNYAQADIKFDVDFSIFTSIATGIKLNSSKFERDAYKREPEDVIGFVPEPNLANWTGGTFTGLHSESRSGGLDSYAYLDEDKWWGFISEKYRNGELIETRNLGNSFIVDEDMTALYVQAEFESDDFRGNVGVRYVDTEQTSEGFADGNPFKETVDYDNVLPSLNLAYNLNEDMIVRFAASSVMARNNYTDLKPGLSINANFGTATGGNPDLKPYEADQADIAFEWYFSEESMLSTALFTKSVENVVSKSVEEEYVENCGPEEDEWDECEVKRPRNTGDGTVNGIEFQVQHIFESGFGAIANYTYVDSELDTPEGKSMVPGVSENSFNFSVFFENDVISSRVAYNWRDEWIGVGAAQEVLNDAYSQWDASITWHAMENLDISLEGVNLTNEVVESNDINYGLTQNTIEFGSRYYLNASYKF
ncbi:TonB-dependent receptor [Catenovulum sp. SM1970]|uniref:TonB-dependent receptor n=1 Tax=Marinifaba aquimaris TaxID=2741323 RepID=UPI001574A7D4|nr:TonB-dependent receptor [Marinifaba aquimaris]NTS76026.1 TonB-dependent receptor [Marinifaba aquimaris]